VKPFYFTHIDNRFAFSSSLNELAAVSNTLNEIAVGDYLLFGVNQDLSTTIFKDIQRLNPATRSPSPMARYAVKPYWTPEPSNEVRFRDP
jgi:asparagine synthetase B (glutamine-hydrolysing)